MSEEHTVYIFRVEEKAKPGKWAERWAELASYFHWFPA
jgi:hypothetical protein